MTRFAYIVSLCWLFLAGCRSGGSVEEATRAIQAQDKVFEDSFNRMNVTGVMSVYWQSPDLIAMYPAGNFRGYDDVKQYWWDSFNAMEVKSFHFTESHISVAEGLAYEWGMFSFDFRPRTGPAMAGIGRYLEVWKRIDKTWLIVADHASVPTPAPSPDTPKK